MKSIEDLLPIELYAKNNKLSPKDVIGQAIMGKLDLYYVFDDMSLVIYKPLSEEYAAHGTENNMIAEPGHIEIEYTPKATVSISKVPLSLIFANNQIELIDVIIGNAPEGFAFDRMLDGERRIVEANALFVNPDLTPAAAPSTAIAKELAERPSNTSLKVIGLLMHHLAKSPKYASGSSPNKSQIKELLLELASELGVNSYGLSKVDERLLADAMKYLEEQKL